MNATVEVSYEHDEQGRPIYLVRVGNGEWESFTDYRQFALYLKSLEAAGEILPPGCWRRFKIEPPCRLNFEPGLMANL